MSEVTKIEVYPLKGKQGKIVAFGKITLNNDIVIDGVKIINGAKGLFVGMPSAKSKEGTYSDIVYISSTKLKKEIQEKMIQAYNQGDNSPVSKEEEKEEEDFPF